MVKVLMVGNDSSVKGGITTVISQFREYNWKKEKINFKFIPTYIDKNNIFKIVFFAISIIRIFFYLMLSRPDIVHVHMSYKGSFYRANIIHKLCHMFNVRDIIHLHGSEFKQWYDELKNSKKKEVKQLLKEASYIIVLGNEWEKRIKNIEDESKIIVVHNTVKIPKEIVRYNKDCFNVVFLGVLIKRKGIHDLLKAISILKEKNVLNQINFKIAGTGEEKLFLENLADTIDITEYVNFVGWVNDIEKKELIKESQLLVLPSYNEGLPMSILEGISFGLPVIATNVGDIPEAVINGKNGFLINPGDIQSLASSLEKIILSGEKRWKEFSKKSKEIATEKFTNEKYFNIFKKIYKGEI